MFVTIGKQSSLGNPIIYDRQDLSREALFDLLSMKVTSQLPAITGEEYRQVDDQYQRLVGRLKE